jgi:hypothetical protein
MLATIMACSCPGSFACVEAIGIGPRARNDIGVTLTSGRYRPGSLPLNTKIMPSKSRRPGTPAKEIRDRLGIIRKSALWAASWSAVP